MPKLVAGGGLSTTYVAEIPVKLQIADVECDTPEQDFDGKDNAWSQVACYGMLSFFTLGVQYAQGILFVEVPKIRYLHMKNLTARLSVAQ